MSGHQSALAAFAREVFLCPDDVAAGIAAAAAERAYPAGGVILRQGDPCAETYLLLLGRARAAAVGRSGAWILLQAELHSPAGAKGQTAAAAMVQVLPAQLDLTLALHISSRHGQSAGLTAEGRRRQYRSPLRQPPAAENQQACQQPAPGKRRVLPLDSTLIMGPKALIPANFHTVPASFPAA